MFFNVANNNVAQERKVSFYVAKELPCVLQGREIIESLCPVSSKTGLRENILSLIKKLSADPAKGAMLMQCLQEIPQDTSMASLLEDDKFTFVANRLSVGTPAENEEYRKYLYSAIELLDSMQQNMVKPVDKVDIPDPQPEKISFNEE